MDRETRLASCRMCLKRKFTMEKGIVCSLTGEWATFHNECADFDKDEIAEDNEKIRQKNLKEDALSSSTGGLHKIGIKNGAVAGTVVFLLGAIWIFVGLVFLNRIFFYPFILLVIGISLIIKHLIQVNKQQKNRNFNEKHRDILDI